MESKNAEIASGVTSWMVCSVGMLVFNKFAIQVFPLECTLVAFQMAFSVVALLVFCRRSLHIGSKWDLLRWSRVVPFFTGMLLTSILALKNAPMSLVVVFRVISPLLGMAAERFFPNPMLITGHMLCSIGVMFLGVAFYSKDLPLSSLAGISWVLLNSLFAVADRLLQRLMLAPDQNPVDISKTAATLLNNLLGMFPILIGAAINQEFGEIGSTVAKLSALDVSWVLASGVVGVLISYTGIWAQSLISATSFLVLVNANKFVIIFFEAFAMHSKVLQPSQALGAFVAIGGGVYYGKARELAEKERISGEKVPIRGSP